jgi:hypothetical protein
VQFLMTDTANPSIARILGTRNAALMSQAPIEQRVQMVQGNFDYTFTGVSVALQKTDLIGRLQQFAAMIAQPPYLQLMLQQPQVFLDVIGASKDLLGLGDRIEIQTELQPMAGPLATISPAVLQMLMQGGAGSASVPASLGPPPMPGPGAPGPEGGGYADPAQMAGFGG